MNGYAITDGGWRGIVLGGDLSDGETFVETIPNWLVEKSEAADLEREQTQKLAFLISTANALIQPLQDDYDVGPITEGDVEKLRKLKIYRSSLVRISDRPGWPETPDWPPLPVG